MTHVQQETLQNGHPLVLAEINVGYDELLEIDKALPGPRPDQTVPKLCQLVARATRPDGFTQEMITSVVTTDGKLPRGMLGFYRRQAAEIPVGTELELLGYELSPI